MFMMMMMMMNNFIRRKTVEVQYKQTAIQEQTAIHEKNRHDKVAGYV